MRVTRPEPEVDVEAALEAGHGAGDLEDMHTYRRFYVGRQSSLADMRKGLVEAAVLFPDEPEFALQLAQVHLHIARGISDKDSGMKYARQGTDFASVAAALNPQNPDAYTIASELAYISEQYDVCQMQASWQVAQWGVAGVTGTMTRCKPRNKLNSSTATRCGLATWLH